MGDTTAFELPRNIERWKAVVESKGASGTILHRSMSKIRSASKFEDEHFLGLRIIWDHDEKDRQRRIPKGIVDQFKLPPGDPPGWDKYLKEAVRPIKQGEDLDNSRVPVDLGGFINVCQFHKHVVAGDTTKSRKIEEDILVSPVSSHTRFQLFQKRLYAKEELADTEIKSPSDKRGIVREDDDVSCGFFVLRWSNAKFASNR